MTFNYLNYLIDHYEWSQFQEIAVNKLIGDINQVLHLQGEQRIMYTPNRLYSVGNILHNINNNVVMINLNPKYHGEFERWPFPAWIDHHLHLFDNGVPLNEHGYPIPTFNKFNWILSPIEDLDIRNLISLEFCPFYSKRTNFISQLINGTLDHTLPQHIANHVEIWNNRIFQFINILNPKFVFFHGQQMVPFLQLNHIELNDGVEFNLNNGNVVTLHNFQIDNIHYFYLSYGLTALQMNMNEQFFNQIGNQINSILSNFITVI